MTTSERMWPARELNLQTPEHKGDMQRTALTGLVLKKMRKKDFVVEVSHNIHKFYKSDHEHDHYTTVVCMSASLICQKRIADLVSN